METFILLAKGERALIDPADWERVSQHRWHLGNKGYALSWIGTPGSREKLLLHRFIVAAKPGEMWDHANGDRLDNRRENLRLCTMRQNIQNAKPRVGGSSQYKGVSYVKRESTFQAYINVAGRRIALGCWDTEEEAARAYDQAARLHFGEFARLNLPCDPSQPAVIPTPPHRPRGHPPTTFRDATQKECAICHDVKPREQFQPMPAGRKGDPHETRCRACNSRRRRKYDR